MVVIYDWTCIVKNCPYSKKIVPATKAEILKHFLDHDYSVLLELAVSFKIIPNKSERRQPLWLSEKLFEFCSNEVNE